MGYFETAASPRSASRRISEELGLSFASSHVVIDAEQTAEDIDQALARIEVMAKERGFAVGSASSLPISIRRIAEWTKTLKEKNIQLIPISAAIRAHARI